MKVQLLPSSFDENGEASERQHLLSIIIDDCVAVDAGSLALACSETQRSRVRDVIISHPHLDHIAGLPLFIDDLFASLTEPVRVHASEAIAAILERDIFNWSIYPRFSELTNRHGRVVEYKIFEPGVAFDVRHLRVTPVGVNHPVAANGFVLDDGGVAIGVTGDTAETADFWRSCGESENLRAVLVECAFPDELEELARVSDHLTPRRLRGEIAKLTKHACPIYVINIKPMYRDAVVRQLADLRIDRLHILEAGRTYEF